MNARRKPLRAGQAVFVLDPWGDVYPATYRGRSAGGGHRLAGLTVGGRLSSLPYPLVCDRRRVFLTEEDARNAAPAAPGLGHFVWA